MNKIIVCLLFSVFSRLFADIASTPASGHSKHWDYERNGPDTWLHKFDHCKGKSQSPIDIQTSQVRYDSKLDNLNLTGYTNINTTWNITHNGHTIVVTPSKRTKISMSGAKLMDVFNLLHFHIHWGLNVYQGSEHTIDGQKYPLEIHFVHNTTSNSRLAALGVLYKLEPTDNVQLNDFLDIISKILNETTMIEQQVIDISKLLPPRNKTNSLRFYRYNGSLTTPPCNEAVTWTLLEYPVPISARQLQVFQHNSVRWNFRPIQKLHTRHVIANFKPESVNNEDKHCACETKNNGIKLNYTIMFLLASLFINFLNV
ncbi:unnamed protein product [Didymodactylos carnosus]|uniref:Carbonic anhydrase n=2 Tax=Didymodactylos carnosus TaxID=1234261 RepID=A0A813RYG8_9BILA|nr:unnamed protein product [Didymodactylos carnosus]CAF3571923.1 unnamed protein product [Didymodactylos carnosus]